MAAGQIDLSFNANATIVSGWANYLAPILVTSGGDVIVGGRWDAGDTPLERFTSTGSVATWSQPTVNGEVYELVQTSAHQLYVCGYSLDTGVCIMRLNSDGTRDTGFTPAVTLDTNYGDVTMALQSDGKVVVGGQLTLSATNCSLARLNTDGTADSSFTHALYPNDLDLVSVKAVAVQADGKILAGGEGRVDVNLRRVLADGTPDSSFTVASQIYAGGRKVRRIAVLGDGKILVGTHILGGSTSGAHLYRLNSDGTLDSGFTPVVLANPASPYVLGVSAMLVQGDGKILITGEFATVGGHSSPVLARVNADGTPDTTFAPSPALSPADTYLFGLALTPTGKIMAAGQFETFQGEARRHLVLIDNDYVVTVPIPTEEVTEGLVFGSSPVAGMIMAIQEAMGMAAAISGAATAANSISDTLAVLGRAHPVLLELLAEGLAFGDTLADDYTAIASVVDRLVLTGEATNYADARSMVVEALVLIATSETLAKETVTERLALGTIVESLFTAMEYIVDTAVAAADAAGTLRLSTLVSESLVLGESQATSATLAQLVRESVSFAVHLAVDNQQYVAWSMNTRNQGLTRYTQYPYNSFAKLGGRYFGLTSTGFYELTGDDDAGVPVPARIRLGMFDFGTRRFKRVPEVYIGYAATGDLLLRAISVDAATGEKHAATYRVQPRSAAVTRESKFKLGAGVKSVDWDFELENINGADFDLSTIVFHPLRTDRRTRG